MGQQSSKKTTISIDEQLDINKKMLDKACREMDREKRNLGRQEAKLIRDMKTNARKGQTRVIQTMQKDLVRNRKYQNRFLDMKTQLQQIKLNLATMKSTKTMTTAMKNSGMIMKRMNQQMSLPGLQKIMKEFQMEQEKMGMSEEMMGEMIDDVMEDDEEEIENQVGQVLDEIGIDLGENIANPGALKTGTQAQQNADADAVDDDVASRMKALN